MRNDPLTTPIRPLRPFRQICETDSHVPYAFSSLSHSCRFKFARRRLDSRAVILSPFTSFALLFVHTFFPSHLDAEAPQTANHLYISWQTKTILEMRAFFPLGYVSDLSLIWEGRCLGMTARCKMALLGGSICASSTDPHCSDDHEDKMQLLREPSLLRQTNTVPYGE